MHNIKKKNMLRQDLKNLLIDLLKKQFNMRLQLASGKLKKTHLIRKVRRNIAYIKTLLTFRINNR